MVYADAPIVAANASLIKRLARLERVTAGESAEGVKLAQTPYAITLGISESVARRYADKLAEQQAAERALIKNFEVRLKNKRYVENAPATVVQQTREQLQAAQARLAVIEAERQRFA
jgi:valyl-tRNA synthetase